MHQKSQLKISIITPCFNEELNISECANAVKKTMSDFLPDLEYEHIFSDNSSQDNTRHIVAALAANDHRIKLIVNSRNVGPFRNMWNAMKSASGDVVIPMLPADLQDPPSVIPSMVEKWKQGNLVVYGVRTNRQESIVMRCCRSTYYRIIRKFASTDIPLDSGEFLLADKRVIDSILKVDNEYPYIRGLVAQTGVQSASVSYVWGKRERGKSSNSFIDLVDQAINGFVSTSRLPARVALISGFVLSLLGILSAFGTMIAFVVNRQDVAAGIPTIIVGILFFGGIQLLFLGIIGEYVLSIHSQVRRMPEMFEVERINF
jgi:glycosyltransferase involved in cell wall biosynthesis